MSAGATIQREEADREIAVKLDPSIIEEVVEELRWWYRSLNEKWAADLPSDVPTLDEIRDHTEQSALVRGLLGQIDGKRDAHGRHREPVTLKGPRRPLNKFFAEAMTTTLDGIGDTIKHADTTMVARDAIKRLETWLQTYEQIDDSFKLDEPEQVEQAEAAA